MKYNLFLLFFVLSYGIPIAELCGFKTFRKRLFHQTMEALISNWLSVLGLPHSLGTIDMRKDEFAVQFIGDHTEWMLYLSSPW